MILMAQCLHVGLAASCLKMNKLTADALDAANMFGWLVGGWACGLEI